MDGFLLQRHVNFFIDIPNVPPLHQGSRVKHGKRKIVPRNSGFDVIIFTLVLSAPPL